MITLIVLWCAAKLNADTEQRYVVDTLQYPTWVAATPIQDSKILTPNAVNKGKSSGSSPNPGRRWA